MAFLKCAVTIALFANGGEAAYPTACSAYTTCAGLQGDCCPNMQGVNLACCFSGALQMDADKAEKEAAAVGAEAAKETASAKAAAGAAQAAADTAKKTQEAAAEKAKEIQSQIDDLNEHATAAQKKARQAAAEATNDATVASKQAMAAESAAAHAKKVEEEQKKIVTETSATAASKKAAADAAQATADKLNAIAGAATKKLNDAKKASEEVAAAAKLKEQAEEKTVAAKNAEAAKIKAAADKVVNEATAKKTAAEGMLSKIDNAQCKKHTGCSGLEGYCCPTLNTNKMHLGSTKLDGESLGCCGAAVEMAAQPSVELASSGDQTSSSNSGDFGVLSMLLAAACGSAVTAMVFKLSSPKEEKIGVYQVMG